MQSTWRAWSVRRCLPGGLQHFASQSFQLPKGRWLVSSLGRLCNTRGDISTGCLRSDGYKTVEILGQTWKAHRVVKITFHGLPRLKEAWQVHHVDGDPTNNRLDNLEYATPSENIRHSFSKPSRRSCGPAKSKPVLWRLVGSTSWTSSPSVTAAAMQLGVSKSTVSASCRKKSTAKSYEFKYQDDFQHAIPGEEWRPMVDPTSSVLVPGRMVSSLGRMSKGILGWFAEGTKGSSGRRS